MAAVALAFFGAGTGTAGLVAAGLNLLGPALGPKQPKPRNQKVTISEEGAVIPHTFGTTLLAGNIIWASKIKYREGDSTKGGLGPPEPGTYYCSFTALLTNNKITRILKIYKVGKRGLQTIYDYNGGTEKGMSFTHNAPTHTWTSSKGKCRIRGGSFTQGAETLEQADKGASRTPAYLGRSTITWEDVECPGGQLPTYLYVVQEETTAADAVARRLSVIARHGHDITDLSPAGISALSEAGEVNYAALAAYVIDGLRCDAGQSARSYLEQMAVLLPIGFADIDGKTTAVVLDGQTAIVIDPGDVGVEEGNGTGLGSEEESASDSALVTTRRAEEQTPAVYTIGFQDPARKYRINYVQESISQGTTHRRAETVMPFTMTQTVARQVAGKLLFGAQDERQTEAMVTWWKHLDVCPTDLLSLTLRSREHLIRAQTIQAGSPGPVRIEGNHVDGGNIYSQPAAAVTGVQADPRVIAYVLGTPVIFEMPADSDVDKASAAFYAGFWVPAGSSFTGVAMTASEFGTVLFEAEATVGVITAGSSLATFAGGAAAWDNTNTVQVNVQSNGTMVSLTDAEVLAGGNQLKIDSEVIGFGTATFVGTFGGLLRYTLSHLRRGQRGTTAASHVAGASWIELDDGIVRVPLDDKYLNVPITATYTAEGDEDVALSGTVTFTVTGLALTAPLPAQSGLLDWAATLDIFDNTLISSGTWTNVGPAHNFTVTDAAADIAIMTGGNIVIESPDGSPGEISVRWVLDGTTNYRITGNRISDVRRNALSGAREIHTTLALGVHTLQMQIMPNVSGCRAWCRPATKADYEPLYARVIEDKEGDSTSASSSGASGSLTHWVNVASTGGTQAAMQYRILRGATEVIAWRALESASAGWNACLDNDTTPAKARVTQPAGATAGAHTVYVSNGAGNVYTGTFTVS